MHNNHLFAENEICGMCKKLGHPFTQHLIRHPSLLSFSPGSETGTLSAISENSK